MRRLLQLLASGVILAMTACALVYGLFYALVVRDLPDIRSLTDYRPNLITRVYSADGHVIGEFFKERREVVPIEQIPSYVVHSFVAVEDDAFYEHEGLDYPGILRAAWTNLRAGGIKQGGSTITQQVAKTFLLSSERTWVRKLKDVVLAKRIEEHLNKNEILFLYLNQIYLGSGAYGVQAAAKTYFDQPVEDITLAQAALIAGVVPAPSRYSPFRNPDLARQRQRIVLRRMVEEGYIAEEDLQRALEEPWGLVEPTPDAARTVSAYFVEEVRRYLMERFEADAVLTGGLSVRTTLDLERQRAAYEAVRRGLRDHDRRRGYRGPLGTVPEAEREETLEALGEQNGAPPWRVGERLRALVTSVDDERELAVLSLGPGSETQLTLEDVEWARTPNDEIDGLGYKVKRVSQVLEPGYLVEVEKTGERLPEGGQPGGEPVSSFALFQEPLAQGALLSMDVESGYVEAMIGGYSFDASQFNRAVQSKRQPGSAFKPIVYAAALENGYTPASIVYDTPIVWEDPNGLVWKPKNYSKKFYGPITLREALARSRNIATIKILRDIKIPAVLEIARELGLEGPFERNLGLALGVSEVTLAELVQAYAVFAAGGRWIDPLFILEVRDREGNLLRENVKLRRADPEQSDDEAAEGEDSEESALRAAMARLRAGLQDNGEPESELPPGYVMDPVTAYLMTDMLKAVVREGTGWRAKQLGRPVAGKTGTTNDLFDAWFLGFSPQTVAGVWVGYDALNSLGKNEAGSRAAAPIWVDFMEQALRGTPGTDFAQPSGIVFARIDRKTGLLAPPGATEFVFQPFREGSVPEEFAPNGTPDSPLRRLRLD